MSSTLFPVFLKLAGRPVVMVGGGPVATSKLGALSAAGARVTVVAPEVTSEIAASGVEIRRRAFEASDLDGAWLVVTAAPHAVNLEVSTAAEARRVFVNAVDDTANASAYLGGVVRRAGVDGGDLHRRRRAGTGRADPPGARGALTGGRGRAVGIGGTGPTRRLGCHRRADRPAAPPALARAGRSLRRSVVDRHDTRTRIARRRRAGRPGPADRAGARPAAEGRPGAV